MKCYKIWRTYCWVYSGHSCSCISNKALPGTFYFNEVLQNWNRLFTVRRMEKAWPFNCCCSYQSVASPSC